MPRRSSSRSPPRRRRRSRSSSRSPTRRRRDRSRERDRRRSRSTDRHHNRSHERRVRSRNSRSDSSEPEERKFVDVRQKLRDGLSSASAGPSKEQSRTKGGSSSPPPDQQQSSMARLRQIESIESDSFRPAQFKSTAGGAGGRVYGHQQGKKLQQTRAERIESTDGAHESSIFGPVGRPENVPVGDIQLPKIYEQPPESPIHPDLSVDPEVRQKRWLELWRERRRAINIM